MANFSYQMVGQWHDGQFPYQPKAADTEDGEKLIVVSQDQTNRAYAVHPLDEAEFEAWVMQTFDDESLPVDAAPENETWDEFLDRCNIRIQVLA